MATVVDLASIKSRIKTLLDSANSIGASPIDLSSGLSNSARVQKVLKINPEMIPFQASFFPLVTCYFPEKTIKSHDISVNQLNSKRRATLNINVCGAVFNTNITSDVEDLADEDINHLMENVELILRSDPDLNGTVKWQVAKNCKYYATSLNSQTNLRVGVLELEAEVFY